MKRKFKTLEFDKVLLHDMDVWFIHFIENGVDKWCHALIEDIKNDSMRIKTTINSEALIIKKENMIAVAQSVPFDKETVNALYRGEIILEENIRKLK